MKKLFHTLFSIFCFTASGYCITDSSGTFVNTATVNGISYAVLGQYAQDIGTTSTNVMVGVMGQSVNTRTGSVTSQHGIGVLGLGQDVSNGTSSTIGVEGRTIGLGAAPQYTGVLGFGDYRGSTSTTVVVGVEARVGITTDSSTPQNMGVMRQLYIPTPVGRGSTESSSYAMYGESTFTYYINGNIGISSSTPVNKFVIKAGSGLFSIGEPVAGVTGMTFENGPITTANYNLAGQAGSTFINRATGGTLYITENNTAQIIFMPTSANIVSVGGFSGTFTNTPLVLSSTVTVSSQLNLPSKTKAQLDATTPSAVGQQFYCSDCATAVTCVSTGTALGAYASSSGRGVVCN